LRDLTTESAQLRIRSGLASLCIAKADSPHQMRVHSEVGRIQSLHVGSSKAILAFGDPGLIDDVVAAGLTRFTEKTFVDPADLAAELEATRARGYTVSRGERIVGALSLGAPVLDRDGKLVGVIALLGPESRMGDMLDEHARHLVKTAAALSHELGAGDAGTITSGA